MSTPLAESTIADQNGSHEVKPESGRRHAQFLIVAILVTAAVWIVLFVARVQAHQADVDDYFYASVAHSLWNGNFVSSFLHTGMTSPLVPAVASPGAAVSGVYGAMAVELPFLLILVAGSYFLARLWISPLAAMVAALVVALNEDVSSYAVTLNFAMPTAAALVWAFYSYIRSRHFRNWKWSLLFGVAIAVVLLSRSMSFVYVAPLVVVVVIDLMVDIVKHGHALRLPALGAVVTTLVLAGPWWLVSGHAAIQYLQSAGYQSSSGFTSHGFALDATTIGQRARWSLSELGWGESWALGIALLAALWAVLRHHRTLKVNALWTLALWALLTTLVLSTSSNRGTGFGLPVIVILILLAAAVLGQMPWRILPLLGVVLAGVLAVGLVAEATGSGQWWPVAPYRDGVVGVGGNFRTNSDLITAQAAGLIGSSSTLVAQQNDILNVNGIRWNGEVTPLSLVVPPPTLNGTQVAIGELARVRMLLTGSSSDSYDPLVDQAAVASAAHRDGFHIIRVWWVSQGDSSFVLWRRGPTGGTIQLPSLTTKVARPTGGSDERGEVDLVAISFDRLFATTGVHFTIDGMAQSTTISAHLSVFVWTAVLDTKTLPDGTYTIQSVAVDAGGDVGRSKPVTFHVGN